MKLKHRYDRWLVVIFAFMLLSPNAVRVVTGGGGSSALSGRALFQRTVDTPGEGPGGAVELKINGDKETFRVDIRDLEGESFGLFLGFSNNSETNVVCDTNNIVCVTNLLTFEVNCTTNCVTNEVKATVGLLSALKFLTNGHWVADYEANDGLAPEQLFRCFTDGTSTNCVTNLDRLAGMFLFIAEPTSDSNTVDAVLFAEVPQLAADNRAFNFKGKSNLVLTTALNGDPPPNPNAKGKVSVKFNASQGRSLLDISAGKLFQGQAYTLYMSTNAGGVVDNKIAELELDRSKVRFKRDTKLGEMLPLSASTVTNLHGINFEIRDAFNDVHVQGTIP